MTLTPADVRNRQFTTTRFRPGYAETEVDAFLDEVEAELDRLIRENEQLRSRLAECLGVDELSEPLLSSPPPGSGTGVLAVTRPEPRRVPAAASATTRDNVEAAARVLALAQQTADQAIAEARHEADETLGHARQEADEVLSAARRQADQVTGEARAQAERLEHDAQERHQQAMGSLAEQREELERRIESLRALESEYRDRLKADAERLLHDLEAAADTGESPAAQLQPATTSPGPPESS